MTTDKVSATSYQVFDPTRGGGNTRNGVGNVIDRVYSTAAIMTDADNIWGNNNESDVASEASDAPRRTSSWPTAAATPPGSRWSRSTSPATR